jgi:hypothetical protein
MKVRRLMAIPPKGRARLAHSLRGRTPEPGQARQEATGSRSRRSNMSEYLILPLLSCSTLSSNPMMEDAMGGAEDIFIHRR